MAITPLPTPPSRQDPTNFPNRADAFFSALPNFVNEINSTVADKYVSNYTDLRAVASNVSSVYVSGYSATTAPSGIAGLFVRDDSDTTSADNNGTIIVASNGKRWKRVFDSLVSVRWFGAKGDGVADDTSAIQAAITFARTSPRFRASGITDTGSPYFTQTSCLLFPPGAYIITAPLWFGVDSGVTGWDASKIVETVSGYGAVLVGKTGGKPVLDLTGAFGMRICGLSIFGHVASAPNIGILTARSGNASEDNPSAGLHRFTDVNIHGDFTLACAYNYASEINEWIGCYMYQNSGKYVYYGTNNNARHAVTSDHCTIATSVQSAYGDTFIGGSYKSSTANTTANGAVFCIESMDFGPKIEGVYIDTSGSVTMPSLWLRNAQGLTSANTTSFNQGVEVSGCVFEYRANQDIVLVDSDHTVIDLTMEGNSMPVNSAGGRVHLNVSASGKVKNLRAQHTDGGTLGDPFISGGTGEIYGPEVGVFPVRSALAGTGWQYVEGDLTRDGAFHTLNLNADFGIPTTARFVAVKIAAKTTAAADANTLQLRGNGVANPAQYMEVTPPVSNIAVQFEGLVPVVAGKIDYLIPANFNVARILIREYHL
jgi:hypothetical protein